MQREAIMAKRTREKKSTEGTELVKRYDGRTVRQPRAIAWLMNKHREVEGYFDQFEDTDDDKEKAKLANKICLALAVHAKLEEDLLYPDAEARIEEPDLVDEAFVEHATAKDLIAQIEEMQPGDEYFEAKVKVLSEYIAHHVKEEETELFPQVIEAGLELDKLADTLEQRSQQLMQAFGQPDSPAAKAKIKAEAASGAHL
jgi:hemerythrin superfamily protein